jgi:acetolactate synthase I/II/III large subunit
VAERTCQAAELAVAALAGFGVDTIFTLNGGHIWPLYDGARTHGMRIIDTRHEQSATWAAEAWAKLTRGPGVAVLTAGPGGHCCIERELAWNRWGSCLGRE